MRRSFPSLIFLALCLAPSTGLLAEEPAEELPVSVQVQFQRIHTDGESVLLTKQVQTGGPLIEETFFVEVEVIVDGVKRRVMETNTRVRRPTKEKIIRLGDEFKFENLDGEKLKHDEVASKIPMGKSMLVLSINGEGKAPAYWSEIFHPDTLIMRQSQPATDADAVEK